MSTDPETKNGADTENGAVIPVDVTLKPQPVMTRKEAELFNLLRLTVQDRYLILAQVPVWCLVEVFSNNPGLRRSFLEKIAFRRVDFVLVHPGTLAVTRVLEVAPATPSPTDEQRQELMKAVFGQVGITHISIPPEPACTVPALTTLLGLEDLQLDE
jgi:Protein of unknown function (DUF2726)